MAVLYGFQLLLVILVEACDVVILSLLGRSGVDFRLDEFDALAVARRVVSIEPGACLVAIAVWVSRWECLIVWMTLVAVLICSDTRK
jgi:hypothetical protein